MLRARPCASSHVLQLTVMRGQRFPVEFSSCISGPRGPFWSSRERVKCSGKIIFYFKINYEILSGAAWRISGYYCCLTECAFQAKVLFHSGSGFFVRVNWSAVVNFQTESKSAQSSGLDSEFVEPPLWNETQGLYSQNILRLKVAPNLPV